MPHPSKRVDRTCEKCGKTFSVPASRVKFGPAKFCSVACKHAAWQDGEAAKRVPRREVKCETCGKVMHLTEKDKQRFCSQACLIVWRDNPERIGRKASRGARRLLLNCEQCGEQFTRYACQLSENRGRFCSRACLGAWTMAHREDVRESKLERSFAATLREQGLTFVTQYRFYGFAIDIAFPQIKLAVEVDGEYWHSTLQAKTRDRKKDALLTANGWRVLRLSDKLITRNLEQAIKQVLDAVA